MPLRSFKEVPGWREAFREAAQRLDEVRTGSLFDDAPLSLCGERIRHFTLQDWVLLDDARNPFVSGGIPMTIHAIKVVWILSGEYAPRGFWSDRKQRAMIARIMRRYGGEENELVEDVSRFIDDAFVDMPGRFAKSGGGISATKWPRKHFAVEITAEIMERFPSFGFEQLRAMPLAQLWQWLHAARAAENAEYRNYQITDQVNADACAALNEINRAEREAASAKQK